MAFYFLFSAKNVPRFNFGLLVAPKLKKQGDHNGPPRVTKSFQSLGRISDPLDPNQPGLWKDVMTRGGGAIMAPLVFQFWGYQKPKTEPWHIFGTKNYLKSHFKHLLDTQFGKLLIMTYQSDNSFVRLNVKSKGCVNGMFL